MSSFSGIQGQILEVTVVGCNKLRDTELFSRQDPYVVLEYASSKFRTRTCTDGGRNPSFQEKFQIPLIEGLREINVTVWNSNTFTADDFIGSCRVQLHKVLSQGYDDNSWPLQTKNLKFAGDVKVIMHFQNASQMSNAYSSPSAPPYMPTAPPPAYNPYAPPCSPGPYATYVPVPYPPSAYPPPPPPQVYGPAYPPPAYPPQPYTQQYPPPPPASPYYPPGGYPGSYPPPY